MACSTPVVASKVGGIKEVVVHNETGLLINLEQYKKSPFEALYPEKFARDLAAGINKLAKNDTLRKKMEKKGRERAEKIFSWKAVAKQVVSLYKSLV
jgi:glycosyltransferase involved in cell wall biosynthesis